MAQDQLPHVAYGQDCRKGGRRIDKNHHQEINKVTVMPEKHERSQEEKKEKKILVSKESVRQDFPFKMPLGLKIKIRIKVTKITMSL